MLDLLSSRRREPAECLIRVGSSGQEIGLLHSFLSEVTVDCSRDRASTATLSFDTNRDEQGRWSVQDAELLMPWQPITIEAVFGNYTEEVMRGYIREVWADYPEDAGAAAVTVECQDESIALDREHVRSVWGGDALTSDRMILTTILSGHGLQLHPDSANGQDGLVVNQDSTDIRFLRERAEANGYELIFCKGMVYFGPMRVNAAPQAIIRVYAGPDTHCIDLSIRTDSHLPDRVTFDLAAEQGSERIERVVAPDVTLLGNQAADSNEAGLREFAWRMTRGGGRNETEMRARAQGRANEMSMKVRAEGKLDGSLYCHVLRVGEPVSVDGVGSWLNGVYYVDRVNHRFNVEGYRQGFTLLRNAYGDNVTSASSVLAGIL